MDILPDASDICITVRRGPGEVCVELPGGITVCAAAGIEYGDWAAIIRDLLGQVNTALAPLGPFFTVFDVISAIVDCVKAIKDALGPPPDPLAMVSCIQGLVEAFDKLLALHPAITIPKAIKSILAAIITGLRGALYELEAMLAQAQRVLEAETRAAELGNFQLQVTADCASDQLDAEFENLNASLTPIRRLFGVINFLLELAGLPCITIPFDELAELTDEVLQPIRDAIDFLEQVKNLIPVPDLSLPAIPSKADKC